MITANEEHLSEARAILLRAAQYCGQGFCKEHYALNAAGESVPPYGPDACAWCGDGACIKASDEIGASRAANYLVRRALILICSARRGTREHPYIDMCHYNDDKRTTKAHVVSALRAAAAVVHLAPQVGDSRFGPGWWKKILAQAKEATPEARTAHLDKNTAPEL